MKSLYLNRSWRSWITYALAVMVLLRPTAAWQAERMFGPETVLIPAIWLSALVLIWIKRSWTLVYLLQAGVVLSMALIVLDLYT